MIVPTTRHSTKCMIIQNRKTTTLCRLRWTTITMVCVSFEMKPQCGLGEYRQRNMPVGKTFRISSPVTTIHVERIYGTSYVSPSIHHYGSTMERSAISHATPRCAIAPSTFTTMQFPLMPRGPMVLSLVWTFSTTTSLYQTD